MSRLSLGGARIGIVLGSGGGAFVSRVASARRTPFTRLRDFAATTVPGHSGDLVVGRVGGAPVAVLSGRLHSYEEHSLDRIVRPLRAIARAGVRIVVLTNAAGGIRRSWKPGDLMLVADHLNAIGDPLAGRARSRRFVDLTAAYDPELRRVAKASARKLGIVLREGVYAAVRGPSYETPAEIRMWRALGADAIGMSTAPEAIALRGEGVRVLAISLIANLAAGLGRRPLDHPEVLAEATRAAARIGDLLEDLVPRLDRVLDR